jgi:hypothetical protein
MVGILAGGFMASLDELEGELIEGTSTIVLVGVIVLAIWIWWKWKKLKVPYQIYPDAAVGSVATGIDYLFSLIGLSGSSWNKAIDSGTGRAYTWASSNLPSYVNSQSWADYNSQRQPEDDISVDANDPYGPGTYGA